MKANKGFTLIEIMIVVAIIAILAAIAIPNFISYRKSSQQSACVANMKAIVAAQEAYAMKNAGYASEVKALVTGGFLKMTPTCPLKGVYTLDAQKNGVTCSKETAAGEGYEHKLLDEEEEAVTPESGS